MTIRVSRSVKTRVLSNQRKPKLAVSVSQVPVPKLPHEHDESAENQGNGSEPRKVIQRAAVDLKGSQLDTDRGPEMNRLYRKLNMTR